MSTRSQAMDIPISGPLVEIEPLSEDQQFSIAQAYRGDSGVVVLDKALRMPGLFELVAIPLYLVKLLSYASDAQLPITKEEILRRFVEEMDVPHDKREALREVSLGFHLEILSELATAATMAEKVSISIHEARALISKVFSQKLSEGQIGSMPQPDAVLVALVSHHLLVQKSGGVEFQHQQFQEWFASHEVERRLQSLDFCGVVGRKCFRSEIVNKHSWEESILFASERISRNGVDGVRLASSLILEALAVDPMLAADAIHRSSEEVWEVVSEQVINFASEWHISGKIDRALRFMIKTGRHEFFETVWSFVGNPNEQVHLEAMRCAGRFRPSVLGQQLITCIAVLAPLHRSHVLFELAFNGGIEGIEIATSLALSETDAEVISSVVDALYCRQANRQMQCLLERAPSQVWKTLAARGYADEGAVSSQVVEQLHQELAQFISEEQDARVRLQMVLGNPGAFEDAGRLVQDFLEVANFDGEARQDENVIFEASRLYPQAVNEALATRLMRGLPLPQHADILLKESKAIIDEEALIELVLSKDTSKNLANCAACVLGPRAVGELIDHLLLQSEGIINSQAFSMKDEYQRLLEIISMTPIDSFTAALLSRAATIDEKTVEVLADILVRHGDKQWQAPLEPSKDLRPALIDTISAWADLLLASELSTRRSLAYIAQAMGRLAAPEFVELLSRMLHHDLAQWQTQREELSRMKEQGIHDRSSEAHFTWLSYYGWSLAAIGNDQAIKFLQSHLLAYQPFCFGRYAAEALLDIWQRQEGVERHILPGATAAFTNVRKRRALRQHVGNEPASPLANALLSAVDELINNGEDEAQNHALLLASIALRMPYGDRKTTLMRLKNVNQPSSAKLGLFTALVAAGELVEIDWIVKGIDELLVELQLNPHLLEQTIGWLDRWLTLLPFTDQPERLLESLRILEQQVGAPWRLGPLASSLGLAPSQAAETVLLSLSKQDLSLHDRRSIVNALATRGTLPCLVALLDLTCKREDAILKSLSNASSTLAIAIREYPPFRMEVYSRLQKPLSQSSTTILQHAIAKAPDQEGLLLILANFASAGREFGGVLEEAIEYLVLERRPSPEWGNAYQMVGIPSNLLRKSLLAIVQGSIGQQAALASSCLTHIDKMRDLHGPATGEFRHPDIDSETPWPAIKRVRNEQLAGH